MPAKPPDHPDCDLDERCRAEAAALIPDLEQLHKLLDALKTKAADLSSTLMRNCVLRNADEAQVWLTAPLNLARRAKRGVRSCVSPGPLASRSRWP
jgi:hypothetical protein